MTIGHEGEGRSDRPSFAPMRAVVHGLDRVLRIFDFLAGTFIGLALLFITFDLFFGVADRYVLDIGFVGSEELARYLVVWLTFLGAYVLVRQQRHIIIDIMLRLAPPWVSRWIAVATGVYGCAVMIYMAITSYQLAYRILSGGAMSAVLPLPRGLFHLPLAIATFLMVFAFLHMALAHLFTPDEAQPLLRDETGA